MSTTVVGTRSATACVRCRRMKTKCLHDDNGQPCRGCLKAQQQCVFPGKIPRPPRPPVIAAVPSPQLPRHDQPAPDHSDFAQQLELHPSYIEDCERALALWPFPCFHRPGFIRQVKEGSLPSTLHFALLSSGGRASPGLIHHFGSPTAASDFFAEKTRANIISSLDCPSILDVQSLCLLAMHHWGSGRGTRAYVFLGMAARMAQMFLPQAMSNDAEFVAPETARRAIWTCFIMDQFLSAGKARPLAFRDESMQIQLPCSEDDFHFGSSVTTPALNGEVPGYASPDAPRADVGEFAHMIRVAVLWRKVVAWLIDPPKDEQDDTQYQQLMVDLFNWEKALPSRQQDTPGKIDLHIPLGNGYAFASTHCVYHCAMIFISRKQLHRMGRRPGGADTDNEKAARTIETIIHSAQRITALVTTLDATDMAEATPAYPIFILFSSFTAASTIAHMTIQGVIEKRRNLTHVVHSNLEVLRKSSPVWPLAERWLYELSSTQNTLQLQNRTDSDQYNDRNSNGTAQNGAIDPHMYGGQQQPANGMQQKSTPSRLPSPFLAAATSYENQNSPPQDAANHHYRDPARDHALFEQHLTGLNDLAMFLGTEGFPC